MDPERTYTAQSDMKMCAFFWCTYVDAFGPPVIGTAGGGGGPSHSCPSGTSAEEVDLGTVQSGGIPLGIAPGCCTEPGTETMHFGQDFVTNFWLPFTCNSPTDSDDMKVMLRFSSHDGASADTCTAYSVEYHF